LKRLQACRLLRTVGSRRPATLWIIKFPQLMFFPGDAPVAITHNVALNEKTIQCLLNPSQHVPTYHSPHFCFPWRRHCDYHAMCSMDGKTIQWLPNPSQHVYLSIFNSFRVIRCLSQCVSPKSLFLPNFCFPWGRPSGNHAKFIWMEREFDAYKLPP